MSLETRRVATGFIHASLCRQVVFVGSASIATVRSFDQVFVRRVIRERENTATHIGKCVSTLRTDPLPRRRSRRVRNDHAAYRSELLHRRTLCGASRSAKFFKVRFLISLRTSMAIAILVAFPEIISVAAVEHDRALRTDKPFKAAGSVPIGISSDVRCETVYAALSGVAR